MVGNFRRRETRKTQKGGNMTDEIKKGAILSDDRKHRFILTRTWDADRPQVLFIGVNPSTADENNDDPTIRRCIGFAKRWDFGGLMMANLFSIRATDPKEMKASDEPNLEINDLWLKNAATKCSFVVAAWGNHGKHLNRDKEVRELMRVYEVPLFCFGITKSKQPLHPLYQKNDAKLYGYE